MYLIIQKLCLSVCQSTGYSVTLTLILSLSLYLPRSLANVLPNASCLPYSSLTYSYARSHTQWSLFNKTGYNVFPISFPPLPTHACSHYYSVEIIQKTDQPVLLKSAQSLSRFLILLSECMGKALLMSSILILLGVSGLFQNRR